MFISYTTMSEKSTSSPVSTNQISPVLTGGNRTTNATEKITNTTSIPTTIPKHSESNYIQWSQIINMFISGKGKTVFD